MFGASLTMRGSKHVLTTGFECPFSKGSFEFHPSQPFPLALDGLGQDPFHRDAELTAGNTVVLGEATGTFLVLGFDDGIQLARQPLVSQAVFRMENLNSVLPHLESELDELARQVRFSLLPS